MILSVFTLFHVVLSLVGIGSGFVVLSGLLHSKRLRVATALALYFNVFVLVVQLFEKVPPLALRAARFRKETVIAA